MEAAAADRCRRPPQLDAAGEGIRYMPKRPRGQLPGGLCWSTFLKNHATAILACDFLVAVTATFCMLYVFVAIEHGTRRLAHLNFQTAIAALRDLSALIELWRCFAKSPTATAVCAHAIGTIRRECWAACITSCRAQ